jgi:Trk K+ transport system NAD-binding subunit
MHRRRASVTQDSGLGTQNYDPPVQRSQKRLLLVITGLIAFTLGAAVLYQIGMASLEGKPRSFLDSLEWAAETLSTTGYGRDVRWNHPAMVGLVIVVQFVGVFLFFLIVPIVLLPFLEERFEERLPRRASEWLSHHVIVFRYGPAVESLLQKLHDRDVPTLVVETDEETARAAADRGLAVVFTRAEEDALDVSRLDVARAIVANGRDEENAALILRARQLGFKGEIYAFVEEPAHRKPMELAGATSAYTPRHIVAAALAAHASNRISPRMPGLDAVDGVQRRELRVAADSPLAGKTLAEAALDAVVVGQWNRSQLHAQCVPSMVIEPGAVLELVGDEESLARAAAAIGGTFLRDSGPFVIAGFGEVGRKVHELLTDVGEEVRVVERRAAPGVDIAGDILDSSVIARAGVASARGLVLALDSDDSTLFATVIARDCAPDVPVIARVNHARNLDNMHRAGADYALSISDISGEMLSSRLLGRSARARDERRRITRIDASEHGGRELATVPLCVIAVERGGITIPARRDLVVDAADVLVVVSA